MLVFVLVWITLFLSSFAIWHIDELVALLLLSFGCLVTVNVLWLFLRVGLQCVIVVFPDYAHLLFES